MEPTVTQVRAFLAVADGGSYAAGADALQITKEAVFQLVKSLTQRLDHGPLVRPAGHGRIDLTTAGEAILATATTFLDAAEALHSSSAIRFSSYPSIVQRLISERGDLLDSDPPLQLVDVAEESRRQRGLGLIASLRDGRLDVVVAPSELGSGALIERPLYSWRLRVVLHDPVGAPKQMTPLELSEYLIAATPQGHLSRRLLDAAFAEDGTPLDVRTESRSQELLRDVVAVGPRHAAVLPDDAFGAPDVGLGPQLVSASGHSGGSYSAYIRASDAEQSTLRGAQITSILDAIVRVFAAS